MPPPETNEPATTPDKSHGLSADDERYLKGLSEDELRESWYARVDYLVENEQVVEPYVSPTGDSEFADRANAIMHERLLQLQENPELLAAGLYVHKSVEVTPPAQPDNVARGADPVELFNGNFRYEATDLRVDGAGVSFAFTRSYAQLSVYSGPLGANWDHCYNLWIRAEPNQRVLRRSNGMLSEEHFVRHDQNGYWVPPAGVPGIVIEAAGSFEYRAPDGTRTVYEPHATFQGIHVVSAIVDPFGNALRFIYSDALLTEVRVNHPDRTVRFAHDTEGRIVAVTDFTGRTWRYAYDDMGDLVAVTTPPTERHPRGATSRYEYLGSSVGDPLLRHCLTTVFDADGRPYVENEYGDVPNLVSYRRIVRQRQGSGDYVFDYADVVEPFEREYALHERPAHETRVRDRSGRETRYLFNAQGNMLLKEETARIGGVPRRLAWHYRYNADGYLIGTWSPLGVISQALYGRDLYERRQGSGDPPPPVLDSELTQTARLGFGNLLAVVHRARYHTSPTSPPGGGLWAKDIFPDIFAVSAEDVVVKYTWDEQLAVPLTASDPRFTRSPDPEFVEDAAYARHLTRYSYRPGGGLPRLFLERIERPTPTLPDGTAGAPVIVTFAEHDARGRVLRTIAPGGVETLSTYAPSADGVLEGFLTELTVDPGGAAIRTAFERDPLGRIVKRKRPRHFVEPGDRFVETRAYDELDQIISSRGTSPMSIGVATTHTRSGSVARVEVELKDEDHTLVDTITSRLRYNDELQLVRRTVGAGDVEKIERFLYDGDGRLFFHIGPSGRYTKATFEDRGLVASVTKDYGRVHARTRNLYDADGRLVRTLDPRGASTRFVRDVFGRPIDVEDALGNRCLTTYDKLGNPIFVRWFEKRADGSFALLSRYEATYDELGRAIRFGVNRFDDPPVVPAADLATAFRDAGPGVLVVRQHFYDAAGNLERQVDPLGAVTVGSFDALGRLIGVVDPAGNRIGLRYDVESNVVRVEHEELVRDPDTDVVVGAHHFAQTFRYDELNRVVERSTPLGTASFRYDSRGNRVATVDYLAGSTRLEYDAFGRLEGVVESLRRGVPGEVPVPVVTGVVYDRDDNVVRVVDALGRATEHRYDTAGRLATSVLQDGSEDATTYDRAGNVLEHRDRAGVRRMVTRDELGRVVHVRIESADPALLGARDYGTTYDGLSRVLTRTTGTVATGFRYDSLGRPLEEATTFTGVPGVANGARLAIRRSFDDRGFLTSVEYPSGRAVQYQRDALGRIVRVEQTARGAQYPGDASSPDAITIAEYAYEGLRLKRLRKTGGLATDLDYDAAGRVARIVHRSNGQPVLAIQLLHDALGNLRQKREAAADFGGTETFRYDSLSRLIETVASDAVTLVDVASIAPSTSPLPEALPNLQQAIDALIAPTGADHTRRYELDLVGNRTSTEFDGDTRLYAPNALDQYESVGSEVRAYDANGNLIEDATHRYGYDANQQLCSVERKSDHRRIVWVLDAAGRRCVEQTGAATTVWSFDGHTPAEERTNGVLTRSLVATRQDDFLIASSGGREQVFLCDAVGSVRYVLGSDGARTFYVYDEYGRVTSMQPGVDDNPFRFSSKRLVADTGKYDFARRVYDPATGRFLQRDPKGLVDGTNLYTYARSNPLANRDPMGLESREERGGPTADTGNAFATRGGSSLVRRNPRGFTLLVPDQFDDVKLTGPRQRIQSPADRGVGIRSVEPGGTSRTDDLRAADQAQLEAWFDQQPAAVQATRGRRRNANAVDHIVELQIIIRPHPQAPGADQVLPDGYRMQNFGRNSSDGRRLANLIQNQIDNGAPEDTPAGGIARERDAGKIRNQVWFRGVMRNLGYYNLGGGTIASLFDFGDNIRDGDWVSATMNGSSAASGMLEVGGLITRSASLLRYSRALGTPGAIVGSGVLGYQVGTHLYENYVDKERAMSAGEWVERKTGSRILGGVAASWVAVQDAMWSMPEAAVDYAGRTWTVDPDEIDWDRTVKPWKWF